MKISLIQMNSINDKAANIAAARELIEKAVNDDSPDWILLPEQFDWAGGGKGDSAVLASRGAMKVLPSLCGPSLKSDAAICAGRRSCAAHSLRCRWRSAA